MRAKQAPEQWEMMLKAIERNNYQEAQMICRVFFGGKKKPKKEKNIKQVNEFKGGNYI